MRRDLKTEGGMEAFRIAFSLLIQVPDFDALEFGEVAVVDDPLPRAERRFSNQLCLPPPSRHLSEPRFALETTNCDLRFFEGSSGIATGRE
jgi:hypothetical protein